MAHAQTMNVAGRFRYATLPGIADFYRWEVVQSIGAGLKVLTGACRLTWCSEQSALLRLSL